MHIHCPHCGKPISADNVNLESAIAKCSNCHAVFGIRDAVEQDSQRHSRNHCIREPVAMPAGFTIEERNGNREIVHRWFTPLYYFLLFFCIFWDGFIIFLYAYAFEKAEVPWFVKLFPILHVGAGVVLTYFTVCCFVNRTIVELGSHYLSIRHEPLPWPGNKNIDASDLDQIYCKERIHRDENSSRSIFELRAITRDGTSQKLLGGFRELEQALYLEQEIENTLGIVDRPVPGSRA